MRAVGDRARNNKNPTHIVLSNIATRISLRTIFYSGPKSAEESPTLSYSYIPPGVPDLYGVKSPTLGRILPRLRFVR